MRICSDIIHELVQQEINCLYPGSEGWKITPRKRGKSYDLILIIHRGNMGTREIIKLLVFFKKVITLNMLEELIQPDILIDGMVSQCSYAIMVPKNADISALPKDLTVGTLETFTFEGKTLKLVKNASERPGTM